MLDRLFLISKDISSEDGLAHNGLKTELRFIRFAVAYSTRCRMQNQDYQIPLAFRQTFSLTQSVTHEENENGSLQQFGKFQTKARVPEKKQLIYYAFL